MAGLGLAAIRDVPVFLHHTRMDDLGNPNPLAGDVHSVYSYSISQGSRVMHDFLWLGFNQDHQGRRVFDGMLNWIGGGNGDFLNYRFAQPARTHRQHIARWYPEFQFRSPIRLCSIRTHGKRTAGIDDVSKAIPVPKSWR